jgi:carbonic anhydrase
LASIASAASWDYKTNNGEDWPYIAYDDGTINQCGETNQSPIALYTKDSYEFTYPVYQSWEDYFFKDYSNQEGVSPAFNGHTHQTNLDTEYTMSYFYSQLAIDVYGAADNTFDAQQFHFHAGSEHTIDGVRHDLEMHTVHYPS